MVSIIVPIYNVPVLYLHKCVNSLISQTYNNIEILLIDDGSDDKIAQFCDKLAQCDARISVYHKKNGGVSSARNVGLLKAQGEYIAFVDSDDWVEPEFIEFLVKGMEDYDAQLSIVGFSYEYESKQYKDSSGETVFYEMNINKLWKDLLHSSEIGGFLWNKLFDKKLIVKPLDEKLHYSEDFVFTAEYCKNVKNAVFIDNNLYHYRQGNQNATANFTFNTKILTLIESYSRLEEIYRLNAPNEMINVKCNKLKIALNLRARYRLNKKRDLNSYNKIQSIIRTEMKLILSSKQIKLSEKINIVLTWAFPGILFKLKCKLLGRKI